jgi:hypothetical protein
MPEVLTSSAPIVAAQRHLTNAQSVIQFRETTPPLFHALAERSAHAKATGGFR